ncbi:MAG: amidohydrolase [Acidobacteriia bacterium]|jgi:predicted TIM-barrel fold metal-dependent hydrolase|nr:amidohydrolase [Terriglobia bacterium]
MIVDSHLHVWHAMLDYPEPTATTVSPCCNVPVDLFKEYMDEYQVDRGVLVQPIFPGVDNSYVADCAAQEPNRFKAVCVVPNSPTACEKLEYWSKDRGCKGLRLRPQLREESCVFGDPSTFPIWETASQLGLVINVLMNPQHLRPLAELAKRFSEVPILIDHMAYPDVTANLKSEPLQSLMVLADFPNIFVKISGCYYFSQQSYPYKDCMDIFKALYKQFGPSRLVWGSDFPHVLLKSGYQRSIIWLRRSFPFLTSEEIEMILGRNAVSLYW